VDEKHAIAVLGALAQETRLALFRLLVTITQRRRSRQLIHSADYGAMNALLTYLTENCCGRDTA
jgi:hypothetical protein